MHEFSITIRVLFYFIFSSSFCEFSPLRLVLLLPLLLLLLFDILFFFFSWNGSWEWESVAAIFFILFFFRLVLCCFVSVCTRDRLGWNGWWWLLSPLTKLSSIGALMHTILNNFHSFAKKFSLLLCDKTPDALAYCSDDLHTQRMMSTVFFLFFVFSYVCLTLAGWLVGRQADVLRSLCCAEKCKRNDNAQIYVYVCRTLNII